LHGESVFEGNIILEKSKNLQKIEPMREEKNSVSYKGDGLIYSPDTTAVRFRTSESTELS
jgi:hypothetical protein